MHFVFGFGQAGLSSDNLSYLFGLGQVLAHFSYLFGFGEIIAYVNVQIALHQVWY